MLKQNGDGFRHYVSSNHDKDYRTTLSPLQYLSITSLTTKHTSVRLASL
jgi:hypothetical protein